MQVAKDFLVRLERGEMPWQFYSRYADIFYDLSTKATDLAARTKKSRKTTRVRLLKWAEYYQGVGDVLMEMTAQKCVLDQIELGNTDVPKAKQKSTYEAAADKHDELIAILLRELRNPPQAQKRSSPTTTKR